jgi:alpha-tubulin suppressor-like RCC1 family protein
LKRIEYFVTNSISINKVWASGSYSSTNGGGCVYFQASTYAMYACGANAAGNLGNASTPTSNVSTPAACSGVPFSTSHATDVAISSDGTNYSTYMLMSDGKLMVAGYNASGQLGTGNTTSVTGSFANAKQTGSTNITTAVQVSVNGGGAVSGSNAMILDSSGYIWSTGNNQFGQLGLGNTTNQNLFTKVTAISNITKVEIGGGYDSYAYAINSSGTFYTWGYNVRNNLFQNNTTSTSTPTAATYVPGTVANAYFARGNNLSTQSQLIVVTTGGKICYAGMDNGMVGIDNTVTSGAYKYIPTPRPILDGTETITDVFVHGSGTSQRLFILTDAGNLYACGANANAICTGGVNSNSMQANVAFSKIAFLP